MKTFKTLLLIILIAILTSFTPEQQPTHPQPAIIHNIQNYQISPKTLERIITQFKKSIRTFTHEVNDTMEYGVSNEIRLTVSYSNPVFEEGAGDQILEAKLLDLDHAFEIQNITDERQSVKLENSNTTTWKWSVIPITGGSKKLSINVNMVSGEFSKSIETFTDTIFINISTADRFWLWMKANWTYITYAIGILAALLGFIYKEKIFQKREVKKQD